jgi:hypothetical protein
MNNAAAFSALFSCPTGLVHFSSSPIIGFSTFLEEYSVVAELSVSCRTLLASWGSRGLLDGDCFYFTFEASFTTLLHRIKKLALGSFWVCLLFRISKFIVLQEALKRECHLGSLLDFSTGRSDATPHPSVAMDLAVGRTIVTLLSAAPLITDFRRQPFPAC